jgi:cell division protein FtsW (lipid II flippase)
MGVCALLFDEVAVDIGMTLRPIPVADMFSPFVSMGGSRMISTLHAVGLFADVGGRRPLNIGPKPFEFAQEDEGA